MENEKPEVCQNVSIMSSHSSYESSEEQPLEDHNHHANYLDQFNTPVEKVDQKQV
jgi:hypothetical protein